MVNAHLVRLVAIAALMAVLPANAIAGGGPPPRFGPRGLEIREPSSLLNAGGFVAYTIKFERAEETAHIDWDLTEPSLASMVAVGYWAGRR